MQPRVLLSAPIALFLTSINLIAQVLTPEQVIDFRGRTREIFFIPDPLPALDAKVHRKFEPASGVSAEAVSYATQLRTRVPVVLYLPKPLPQGRIPAFIVVNGHGGDKYAWYPYFAGITYARAGAAVLTYDTAGEGERNAQRKSGTRAHDRLEGDGVMARRLCGLMMTDVMQAVSYLSSRPEVDASRIGAGGYSLGSFVLSLTGAVETRLRACVMVGGGNLDGPDEYWDNSKPMCQGQPYRSLHFLGDRAAVIYALHAARGPSLAWNGRADTVVNMDKAQEPFFNDLRARVIKLHGKAEGVLEFGFDDAASHRPYFLTKPVAMWLEQQLDFPNWTEGSIVKMSETRIGEWAQKNGAFMNKALASEEREGGVRAVGDNVPGCQRENLSVFTPEEWENVKRDYIFETWSDAARAERN